MRTLSARSVYGEASLQSIEREFAKCNFDLIWIQEVRWDKGGIGQTDAITEPEK